MGFSSWNCRKCGQSVKAPYDIPPDLQWQNSCIAILKSGRIVEGNYDGYGNIGGTDVSQKRPTIYHRKCWDETDQDKKYHGQSKWAEDQGFFYRKH